MLVPLHQNRLLEPPTEGPAVGLPVAIAGDPCGGTLLPILAEHVQVNGLTIVVQGDPISSHGSGIHVSAVMAVGSAVVFANGIPVVRTGDTATCGHAAVGSSHVSAS